LWFKDNHRSELNFGLEIFYDARNELKNQTKKCKMCLNVNYAIPDEISKPGVKIRELHPQCCMKLN